MIHRRSIANRMWSSLSVAAVSVFVCGGLSTGTPPAAAPQEGALRRIEGERGGRHWVDAETAPPKSPQASLACFEIEPGFEIELVAAEPLVRDPVAITFDARGRLFAVEYGDYPSGPTAGEPPLSRVVYLEDSDGNGRVDRRHVFADQLHFANSLMPLDGGLLVAAATEIVFLKDTNDDHVADVREVWFDGFQPAHPQMQISCPQWGIDNWIYLNYGPGRVASHRESERRIEIPRRDFRFHPRTLKFEADSGLGQYGNTIDRWGHRFFCTNRNPIMTTLLRPAAVARNPYATIAERHYDVGRAGGNTRVYPLVEMKSNYLSHAGTHTAACGVTAYHGILPGAESSSSLFVCEPIGHLVTRSIVEPQGLRLNARRARPRADFLASTDTWFRPASLANGPDGALYLADMYRLWVEHPKFLPPEVAGRLDLRAGDDRGRIYRIAPKGLRPTDYRPPTNLPETVGLLSDPNAWRQFVGQRLLVEQQRVEAIPLLRKLLREGTRPTARLHAIWTLDGLAAVTAADALRGLHDSDPHVRRDAVRLSPRWIDDEPIFEKLAELIDDRDPRVRFEVAIALGATPRPESTALLATLASRDGHDPWFVNGLLTSVANRSAAILATVIDDDFAARADAGNAALLKRLATVVAVRGDAGELKSVFATLAADQPAGLWWRAAVIDGLGEGLPRSQGPPGRTSLSQLIADPPPPLAEYAARIAALLTDCRMAALDSSRPPAERAAAVELLAYQPLEESRGAFAALLSADHPVEVQSACVDALSAVEAATATEIVLDRWTKLGPTVRGPAVQLLLRRADSTRQALAAMASGRIDRSALNIDQRVLLLQHRDDVIRTQAESLFGGAVSTDRRQVAEEYAVTLSRAGSAEAGKRVFQRACSQCHLIDGQGHAVGPDISDVRNRSRPAVLHDILDPNAKVEPRYTAYTVLTQDGKSFTGLIVAETPEAVVLKMAEGKQYTIGRNEIDTIRSSEVSLMPVGIEKEVSIEDMTNLLEFLKPTP